MLFLLVLTGFSVQSASAQVTFKVNGSKNLTVSSGGRAYVDVTNLTAMPLTLGVTILNMNTHLSFAVYQNNTVTTLGNSFTLTATKDSLGNNHNYIVINYLTISPDSFLTSIVLTDAATQTTETITIAPADIGLLRDKDILSVTPPGPFKTHPGSNTFDFVVHNSASEIAHVQVTTGNTQILFASQSVFDVPAGGTFNLTLTYFDNSKGFIDSSRAQHGDSLIFKLMPLTPLDGKALYFEFWVQDTVKAFFDLAFAVPSFLKIPAGTKVCRTVTITNSNDESVNVDALDITGTNASLFSFEPIPTFPLTINGHSSATFSLCATAPADHNKPFYGQLTWTSSTPAHPAMHNTTTLYGSTGDCISSAQDTLRMGDVIAGGWVDGETTITNTLSDAVTFTSGSWDYFSPGSSSSYTATNLTYPFTMAAGESKTVQFHLLTETTTQRYGYVYYSGFYTMHYTSSDANCSAKGLQLAGKAVVVGDSTSSNLELFPVQTELLPITSNKQTTTLKFRFSNNMGQAVKIVSVTVKDGTHFTISQINPSDPPFTLQANGVMEVLITFDANLNGFYTDDLIIVTDKGLLSQTFSLQGLRTGALGVAANADQALDITLSPNPARSIVTIGTTGIRSGNFELLDMLGTRIAERLGGTQCWWNISALAQKGLSDGSYFVRASGIANDGKPFVITKRLIITK